MANKPNGVIYVGVTDNLEERVKEHKLKMRPDAFTAKYNCNKLVYLEEYNNSQSAILRAENKKMEKNLEI